VIPLSALGEMARINRDVRHVTVPGAGHDLPHSHPRQVAAAMEEFLREM
jgi:pimeloyl-ACP methyl ester carboxylesterase